MNMDPRDAVIRYQHGERAKSELIIASQLLMTLPENKDDAKTGAKRMLLSMMQAVRTELAFSLKATEENEFNIAIDQLNEAISLVESDEYEAASVKIGSSISAATTVAQMGWQVLKEHGLI
jgi:hypothetical protein